MSRSLLLLFVLAATPFGVACNKSTEEPGKVDAAQNAADEKVARDFAAVREDYRQWVRTNLDALTKELDDLDAKAKSANGAVNADRAAAVHKLRAQRAAFVADFQSIESATADTWDETKTRLDKEWLELKSAADKAV